MSATEYDDGLTPDRLVLVIEAAVKERDFKAVGGALALLSIRVHKLAEEVRTLLQAGIILGRARLASEGE